MGKAAASGYPEAAAFSFYPRGRRKRCVLRSAGRSASVYRNKKGALARGEGGGRPAPRGGFPARHLRKRDAHQYGTAYGIRTRVTGVRGRRPRPLDERGVVLVAAAYRGRNGLGTGFPFTEITPPSHRNCVRDERLRSRPIRRPQFPARRRGMSASSRNTFVRPACILWLSTRTGAIPSLVERCVCPAPRVWMSLHSPCCSLAISF